MVIAITPTGIPYELFTPDGIQLTVMNRDLPAVTIPQVLCGISGVKVVPFEFPGTQRLGQAILSVPGERGRAALPRNPGAFNRINLEAVDKMTEFAAFGEKI